MVANNLAVAEWKEEQLHRQAQTYSDPWPITQAEIDGAARMNRARENLEQIEHRIEARHEPAVTTIDELIRRQLTDKQLNAIDMLVMGSGDADIARSIGVHRATVARWRLFHPVFVAELSRRRHAEIQNSADKLRRLAMQSIEVFEKQLNDDTHPALRLRAAITLLKMAGVESAAKQRTPMSAEEMVDDMALSRRKRKHAIVDNGEREDVYRDLAVIADTCFGGKEPVRKTTPIDEPDNAASSLAPSRSALRAEDGTKLQPGVNGLMQNVQNETSNHSHILKNIRIEEAPYDGGEQMQDEPDNGEKAERTKPDLSGLEEQNPAQQPTDSEPDCCAPKSSINNDLTSRRATGATNEISNKPSDPVESQLLSDHKPIIGIIGGIGSGKSFVANLFEAHGAKVIHADDLVHIAYQDPKLQAILRSWWGDSVIKSDGSVDRKYIADKVFKNDAELKRLEGLLHPLVLDERAKLTGEYLADEACTAIVWDIPLLIETNLHTLCDAIVFVDVSQKIRLERVKGRGWTENELLRRENLQIALDKKRDLANYYISNETDIGSARDQVRQVYSRIIANMVKAGSKPQ